MFDARQMRWLVEGELLKQHALSRLAHYPDPTLSDAENIRGLKGWIKIVRSVRQSTDLASICLGYADLVIPGDGA